MSAVHAVRLIYTTVAEDAKLQCDASHDLPNGTVSLIPLSHAVTAPANFITAHQYCRSFLNDFGVCVPSVGGVHIYRMFSMPPGTCTRASAQSLTVAPSRDGSPGLGISAAHAPAKAVCTPLARGAPTERPQDHVDDALTGECRATYSDRGRRVEYRAFGDANVNWSKTAFVQGYLHVNQTPNGVNDSGVVDRDRAVVITPALRACSFKVVYGGSCDGVDRHTQPDCCAIVEPVCRSEWLGVMPGNSFEDLPLRKLRVCLYPLHVPVHYRKSEIVAQLTKEHNTTFAGRNLSPEV